MTVDELISRLEKTGYSFAEIAFTKTPTYPAIVYFIDPDGEGSDNENLINNNNIRLELYQTKIDKSIEKKIQNDVLFDVEYSSNSTYIDSEHLYVRYYECSTKEKI